MRRGIQWDGDAWEDYCEWQKDKPTLKRINGTDRLTYKVLDDMIVILACKGHCG